MSWIELLDNSYFLKRLFPLRAPSLDWIRLHEIRMLQEGPVVSLRFDLAEYPLDPPKKWEVAQYNTVQVCLAGIGIREISIRGWSTDNVGCLVVKTDAERVIVQFNANACRLDADFDFVRVESVTAYQKSHRG